MKVVIFDVETWEREGFETLEDKHEVCLVAEPLDESNASEYADAEIVSGFIYSEFSAEVLHKLPRLRMIAYDVRPDDAAAESLGFRYVTLEALLAESDVISLHVPSNKKTRHLIGRDEFAQMKDGAVLINTARGDLIESRALIRALAEQKLSAAGLDVLPEEPVIREEAELLRSVYEERHDLGTLLANHLLVHMRNVIVTPHSGFNTREAVQRISDTTRENIVAFASGEPIHVVE